MLKHILRKRMKKNKKYSVVWCAGYDINYEDVTCIKVMPKSYAVRYDRTDKTGRINHSLIMELTEK